MKRIHSACKRLMEISDAELQEAWDEAERQVGYVHPLRMKSASETNKAGRHNIRVLKKLRELRKEISTP